MWYVYDEAFLLSREYVNKLQNVITQMTLGNYNNTHLLSNCSNHQKRNQSRKKTHPSQLARRATNPSATSTTTNQNVNQSIYFSKSSLLLA
jgi:hypothetical protein